MVPRKGVLMRVCERMSDPPKGMVLLQAVAQSSTTHSQEAAWDAEVQWSSTGPFGWDALQIVGTPQLIRLLTKSLVTGERHDSPRLPYNSRIFPVLHRGFGAVLSLPKFWSWNAVRT